MPDSRIVLIPSTSSSYGACGLGGWRLRLFALGRIPDHSTRYQLAQALLAERDPELLRMLFNKVNCKDVVQDMLLAPVSQDNKGRIMKVKVSERNKNFPAHHTSSSQTTWTYICSPVALTSSTPVSTTVAYSSCNAGLKAPNKKALCNPHEGPFIRCSATDYS